MVHDAMEKFDASVETVEKFSRISKVACKRERRETIKLNQTLNHDKIIEIAKVHSTSALMLQEKSSLEAIMEVSDHCILFVIDLYQYEIMHLILCG